MKITTIPFKISAGEYLSIIFKMFIKRWWWAFASVLSCVFALAVFNVSFIFVGLILIFIIIPMIMSFLYIYYGLLPQSRLSILEKVAEISADEIVLQFENREERIALSDFSRYVAQKKWIVLPFKHRRYCFFVIPYVAFNSTDDLRTFVNILR